MLISCSEFRALKSIRMIMRNRLVNFTQSTRNLIAFSFSGCRPRNRLALWPTSDALEEPPELQDRSISMKPTLGHRRFRANSRSKLGGTNMLRKSRPRPCESSGHRTTKFERSRCANGSSFGFCCVCRFNVAVANNGQSAQGALPMAES